MIKKRGKIMVFGFLFNKKKKNGKKVTNPSVKKTSTNKKNNEQWANRKGELGEYKINIQLDQFPKNYKYHSDLLIKNGKSSTGYSQIDHVIITPYGIFVIETKNYQGTIYGEKNRKTWLINGKFKMMNPLLQNYGHMQAIKDEIDKKFHEHFISIVSFTKRCTLKIDPNLQKIQSNELVIYDILLSEVINRKIAILKMLHNQPVLTNDEIEKIYNTLSQSNVLDPSIRKQHVEKIITNKENDDTAAKNKCVICKKPVSNKVQSYCLSNPKFKGNIYCYEHQKNPL
ncbi:nuclease-related domain-containing protein [Rummeliibacillus pycnus]|uniref:nuclease-related domain-containing protein n=1 Tax=Rummeliibacillus pycnus TaxID=101070 RepID=UPI001FEA6F70|nr:nuclease-related domain-containing protein [Rummeliibacillus pycnus]